jgi:hypothetical protein
MKEEEVEMEETIREDESEMAALQQEEELFTVETRRIETIHKGNVAKIAAHKKAAVGGE